MAPIDGGKTKRAFYLSSACLKKLFTYLLDPKNIWHAQTTEQELFVSTIPIEQIWRQTPFSSLSQKRQILIESKMEKGSNSENLEKRWYTASFVAFHVMCVYI